MPYVRLTQKETENLIKLYHEKIVDKNGMSAKQALTIAQKIWGSKAYAVTKRRFTSKDPVSYDGYVIPVGIVWGFEIGYTRKGKRGAELHTGWHGDTFLEAFISMYDDYTTKRVKNLSCIGDTLMQYGILNP